MTPARREPTAEIIAAECAGWRALVDLLSAEQDALRAADTATIESLSRRKGEHVSRLDAQAREREALMRARGLPINAQGLELWFSLALAPAKAREFREDLARHADLAKRLNRQNGALVARLQRYVQGAFAALALAAGAELTYDGAGVARPVARRRASVAI
ncbi:MAG: flagellar protein FlgN [Burkholderiales bacterium]